MNGRKEYDIGNTVLGEEIQLYEIPPPSYATPKEPVLLYGAIHGDEPLGVYCLVKLIEELIAEPPGRPTWIIPALNIDGLKANTKNNANDVDLNRNFSARNWVAEHEDRYNPGTHAESEPEIQALVKAIKMSKATRLIALHSPFRTVNYDGSAKALAEKMGELNGYGASASIGYPTPGSFGSKYGVDLNNEVITLEIPPQDEESAWKENRSALRYSLDLKP